MRNLDITTLRSFVAVADAGGVTRAAGHLNLTQSAVSMQLKRMEEMLDIVLLDRSRRGVTLTAAGDQLLTYARQMVALNDELVARLTDQAFEGEISLGVPHDIVYPVIPRVLQQFHAAYPRVKVHLRTSYSAALRDAFARGECDLILATETSVGEGAETLAERPLVWIGAPSGSVWRQAPLRVAFERHCSFRPQALAALDRAGTKWETAVDTDSDRTIEATVAADLAVNAMIAGTQPAHLEQISHGGALPDLPMQFVNLYTTPAQSSLTVQLVDLLRRGFQNVPRVVEAA
ncbi:MAG: LysR family transcriptional regulator [Pseudomonadota bacterium]